MTIMKSNKLNNSQTPNRVKVSLRMNIVGHKTLKMLETTRWYSALNTLESIYTIVAIVFCPIGR